ncbi:OsmC family protein [Pseudomonas sp. dw_358]|uniref:OsmC family protein n=1 Tax=Pseudomonas sp. dw_358 TaxID=2720083 RepID=UPI001BD3C7DB|nr:OsmC family protein [Pseudomonas sp. dw_358]
MAETQHDYQVQVVWTGNTGNGTASYRGYSRAHQLHAEGKPLIEGSADPAFRGDSTCWNPEELLVASLAACHKLWYLGLCAEAGVCVLAYADNALGTMVEERDGAGQFSSVVLRPRIVLAPGSDLEKARALHHVAHEKCFIARSVNFAVRHEALMTLGD